MPGLSIMSNVGVGYAPSIRNVNTSRITAAALVLLTMAPAMVHLVARHVVFFKALRKPATSSVPWAMKTRATVMTADPCVVLPKTGVAVSSLHCP